MPKRYCVTVQYVLAGLIDDFLVGGEGGSHRKNLPLFGGGGSWKKIQRLGAGHAIFYLVKNERSLKNIFEEEKKFNSGTRLFLLENSSQLQVYFGQARTSNQPRNCPKKYNIPATKQSKTA